MPDNLGARLSALARQQAAEVQAAAPFAPRRAEATQAEEPPSSAALLKLQTEADLLREQLEQRRIENAMLRDRSAFVRGEQDHIRLYRQKYSSRVFWLTVVWLLFCAGVIVASGLRPSRLLLSDAVLIAVTGSALTSVIGMFLVILNWLYPRERDPK